VVLHGCLAGQLGALAAVALAESLPPAAAVLPLSLVEGSTEQVQVEAGLTVAPVAGSLLSAAAVLPVVLPVAPAAVVLPVVLPAPSLTARSSQGSLRTRIKRRTLSSSYAKLQARGS